jgi:N-acetylglucosaminyldiphosphoundecaprenol N-acetyl-beta-D-mannosaminyltransferase
LFIHAIYGVRREQYTGSDLFRDIVYKKKYTMMFLGSSKLILESLQNSLVKIDERISEMHFVELPFCKVEEFDYKLIAEQINRENPDIIWISLGMPKQEIFMYTIKSFINRGVMIGVGAAFKFHSGLKEQKRAPKWMIKSKLEWLYRIFSEPRKQVARCFLIIRTIPGMILQEYKIKRKKDVL